ncbi:AraC family transcriptional regulator [Microbulbifer litoralis]|uniref:AraC family transcriptional regulator n=1 Tax=Microbulbifer litoralis TaxID=2933965 RepID=UPI0020295DD7|nr:AraC family transcriptional regulator [Microbulbifer sp. GX H0434]
MPDNFDHSQLQSFIDRAGIHQLVQSFDLLPDISFWIKDAGGHFLFANRHTLEVIGTHCLEHTIGLTDYDIAPRDIAEQFIADDQRVLRGEIIDDRLEMNILRNGDIGWFLTSKRPIFDRDRRIIGSYGVSRHVGQAPIARRIIDQLRAPIDFIREHYSRPITIREVADSANLSVSALERRFKTHLGKTPMQFLNEFRLINARRLLTESALSIATVAERAGFADPGYFSRQFARQFGELPSAVRAAPAQQ